MPGTCEGLPISARSCYPAVCRLQRGLRYFLSSDPHHNLRPGPGECPCSPILRIRKLRPREKTSKGVTSCTGTQVSWWSFAFPNSPPPALTTQSSMASKAGVSSSSWRGEPARVGFLPGHRAAWLHPPVCREHRAAASSRGSTRWRGGTQQCRASYPISGPQLLVCKMGLIIPSLGRGLAIYM